MQRQEQLHAASSATHDADSGPPLRLQHPRARSLEAIEKSIDGLYRNGVVGHAWYLSRARCRADVDRQDIVRYRRPIATDDAFSHQIQANRLALVEPGLGKATERSGIDVCCIVVV